MTTISPLRVKRPPSRLPRWRFYVGLAILAGIVLASFANIAFSPCVWLRIGPLILMCPLGFLEISLAGRFVSLALLPGFVLVCLLIFSVGRLWCGWVCPASLAGGAAAGLCALVAPRPVYKGVAQANARFSAFARRGGGVTLHDGFAVLAGVLLGVAVFSYPFWSIVCPLGVVSRNLISMATQYAPRLDSVFLLLPLLVAPFIRGGWKCACPVGLVHALCATKKSGFAPAPQKESNCVQCGVCHKICPTGLDPSASLPDPKLCIRCGACIEKCPQGRLAYKVLPGGAGQDASPSKTKIL